VSGAAIAGGGESLSAQGLLLRIMPGQSTEAERIPSALVDAIAFAATLVFAGVFRWEARELIWGLWASSLVVGYAHIVTGIAVGVVHTEAGQRIVSAIGGLLMLAFFTVHFGMFHFVHSIFLSLFFPLLDQEAMAGSVLPANLFAILGAALKLSWPLVLMTVISRVRSFPFAGVDLASKNAFMAPYASVVKMHILIFVFAGLHAAGLSRFAIYPVLAFYFFPWGSFRHAMKKRSRR